MNLKGAKMKWNHVKKFLYLINTKNVSISDVILILKGIK